MKTLVLLLVLGGSSALLSLPAVRITAPKIRATAPRMEEQSEKPRIGGPNDGRPMTAEERERADLYAGPSFELDATTITALLGAAIAFQFFVLGNL